MKILFFAKAYPPEVGGVETYSEQVAIAYARAGHVVTVVTTHPGAVGTEQRGDVQVINVGQHGGQGAIFMRMLTQLWTLRQMPFDFIHATTWRVALPALIARRSLPMVLTMHGREVFVVPRPLRPLMRAALRHASHLPTVSQAILDKVNDDLPYDIPGAFANWNGISFEGASKVPHDKPTDRMQIFCMCRLVERKNLHGAIDAVAALIRDGHPLTFKIAGGGEEEDRLRAQVTSLGMDDHIQLLGRVPDADVFDLYRQAHVFLHPQITTRDGQDMEGFGLTIADAMSFGVVPVAGASGGPLDFVETGKTGYLVDGTDTDAIAGALIRLIEDKDHLKSLGTAAQQFAWDRITWDAHVAKILGRFTPKGP